MRVMCSEENVNMEEQKIKSGKGGQLTTGDILQALERGDEVCYLFSGARTWFNEYHGDNSTLI